MLNELDNKINSKSIYSVTMFLKKYSNKFDSLFEHRSIPLIQIYFKTTEVDRNIDLYQYKMCIFEHVFNKDRTYITTLLKTGIFFDYDRLKVHKSSPDFNYKDSSSLKHFIAFYGEEEGVKRFNEKSKKCSHTELIYIEKYGEEEGARRWKEFLHNNHTSLPNMIKKYGEEEGKKRWESFCERNRFTNTVEYYIEEYGKEEGEKLFYERRRKKCGVTEDKMIKKYGEEEGKKRWKSFCDSKKHSEDKMIKKYGEEEGKKRWKSFCDGNSTVSLKSFIERYGEEEGVKKFNEYREKSRYTKSLEGHIEKYGEEEGFKKFYNKAKYFPFKYSQISQDCFEEIISTLNLKSKIYTATRNHEYCLILNLEDRKYNNVYYLDYVDIDNNICIEFNGDIYHGNPSLYEEYETPNPFSSDTCKEMWEMDKYKIDIIKKYRNFRVYVIWEYEWKNNKEQILKEIKELYNDN